MKLYLAGPMSHHPQFNFPLFDEAAHWLRSIGFEVVSPAELDDADVRAAALASPDGDPNGGPSWGEFLARDVKIVGDDVDGVAVMPEWWTSRGARLEAYVAWLSDKPVYRLLDLFDREDALAMTEGFLFAGFRGYPAGSRTLQDLRKHIGLADELPTVGRR